MHFASKKTYVAVLTQNNREGEEHLVSFMRSKLEGANFKYPLVDKQASVILKEVKYFLPFILKSFTKLIIHYLAV